jgi:hypothetical protein
MDAPGIKTIQQAAFLKSHIRNVTLLPAIIDIEVNHE